MTYTHENVELLEDLENGGRAFKQEQALYPWMCRRSRVIITLITYSLKTVNRFN